MGCADWQIWRMREILETPGTETMPLDFRRSTNDQQLRRRTPPDYLSRRTQYRIFLLVGSLFLVFFLMEQARQPENWRWIWTIGSARAPVEEDVDTRLRPPPESGQSDHGAGPLLISVDGQVSLPAGGPGGAEQNGVPQMIAESDAAMRTDAAMKSAPSTQAADAAVRQARHDLWSRLLESLAEDQRSEFLAGLKAARNRQALEANAKEAWAQIVEHLQAGWQNYVQRAFEAVGQDGGQLTDAERRSWLEVIEALEREWDEDVQPALRAVAAASPPDSRLEKILVGVQQTLDQVFLDAIRDNTVFRKAEKDAWFRMLEQLDQRDLSALQQASLGYVGFLQLYKQPESYRGKLVTVAGTIRLGYYREAPPNLYGIPGYYVFWLRPAGGTSPIVVYCLEIPEGFPDVARLERDGQRPQLDEAAEFTGFFFKRWAYRAQDDTRLAPLVLAKIPRWERPADAGRTANQPPGVWFWTALFGGTAGFGIGLAALFFWLTRRSPPPDVPLQLEPLEPGNLES